MRNVPLGLGLTQVPDYMAVDAIASKRLVEVLRAFRPPAMPIQAVMPANRMVPARVRAVLDALVADRDAPATPAKARPRGRRAAPRPAKR